MTLVFKYSTQPSSLTSTENNLQVAPSLTKKHEIILNQTDLSCLQDFPQPTILVSRGRSGSSAIWEVLGNITGQATQVMEYTGGNTPDSKVFFRQHQGAQWLVDRMCKYQRQYPKAAIVGFKWKPNRPSLYSETAQQTWQLVAALQGRIKIVHSKRSPLDMIVSQTKHGLNPNMTAHCRRGDDACQAKQVGTRLPVSIPVLLEKLNRFEHVDGETDAFLESNGIPRIQVSYEQLFFTESVTEWQRIGDFLGVAMPQLSIQKIRNAGSFTVTSTQDHRTKIANYDQVAEALRGTRFAKYLH